jgi:hypothetical protein
MKKKGTATKVLIILGALFMAIGGLISVTKPDINVGTNGPISISQEINILPNDLTSPNYSLRYKWEGKIKNVSDKDVVLSGSLGLEVTLSTNDEGQKLYGPLILNNWFSHSQVLLAPGEEFDLSTCAYQGGNRIPDKIEKVSVIVIENGLNYRYVLFTTSMTNNQLGIVVLLEVIGGVLLFIGLILLLVGSIKKSVAKSLEKYFKEKNVTYQVFAGYYVLAKEEKNAVTKTIFSAVFALITSVIVGFGVYKIYGNAIQCTYIITSDGKIIVLNRGDNINKEKYFESSLDLFKGSAYKISKGHLMISPVSDNQYSSLYINYKRAKMQLDDLKLLLQLDTPSDTNNLN